MLGGVGVLEIVVEFVVGWVFFFSVIFFSKWGGGGGYVVFVLGWCLVIVYMVYRERGGFCFYRGESVG